MMKDFGHRVDEMGVLVNPYTSPIASTSSGYQYKSPSPLGFDYRHRANDSRSTSRSPYQYNDVEPQSLYMENSHISNNTQYYSARSQDTSSRSSIVPSNNMVERINERMSTIQTPNMSQNEDFYSTLDADDLETAVTIAYFYSESTATLDSYFSNESESFNYRPDRSKSAPALSHPFESTLSPITERSSLFSSVSPPTTAVMTMEMGLHHTLQGEPRSAGSSSDSTDSWPRDVAQTANYTIDGMANSKEHEMIRDTPSVPGFVLTMPTPEIPSSPIFPVFAPTAWATVSSLSPPCQGLSVPSRSSRFVETLAQRTSTPGELSNCTSCGMQFRRTERPIGDRSTIHSCAEHEGDKFNDGAADSTEHGYSRWNRWSLFWRKRAGLFRDGCDQGRKKISQILIPSLPDKSKATRLD